MLLGGAFNWFEFINSTDHCDLPISDELIWPYKPVPPCEFCTWAIQIDTRPAHLIGVQ